MRFTAQEEYGLRCLLQIAREPGEFMTITEIAKREGLTSAYVAKLMRALRKAGLVKSIRGQKGGFRLATSPDRINVGEVLASLGGRLYTKDFCGRYTGNEQICTHSLECSIRSLWMTLDLAVQRALAGITLKHMLNGAMIEGVHLALVALSSVAPEPLPGAA